MSDPGSGHGRRDDNHVVQEFVDLARSAVAGDLLTDAAAIDGGLVSRGWTWSRRGGQWATPYGASGITQLTPPSLDLIVGGEDDDALARAADEVVARLEQAFGVPDSHGLVPECEPQVDAVWERPPVSVVVSLIPATCMQSDAAPGERAEGLLWLKLSRSDVADTEEDGDRAFHLALHGTLAERWHLTGQAVLPDGVVALLEDDEDPRVVRAVRFGAQRREDLTSSS